MARNATDPKVAERLSIVGIGSRSIEGHRRRVSIVLAWLGRDAGGAMRPFELARELAVLLEVRAAEASVALEVTGSTTVELNADRRKLRQVLLNLVLNAVQASPAARR